MTNNNNNYNLKFILWDTLLNIKEKDKSIIFLYKIGQKEPTHMIKDGNIYNLDY